MSSSSSASPTNPASTSLLLGEERSSDWIQCHDFTQDKQASNENIHVLENFDVKGTLQVEFMEILMQAPELQSLIIDEQSQTTMDHNLLLLQGLHLPQH